MERVGEIIFMLALIVLAFPSVHAVDAPAAASQAQAQATAAQNAVNARVDEANRFLAAETTRQIKTESDAMLVVINKNNDDNFAAFDGRMQSFMADTKNKVIIGGIGAILVANALVAILMVRTWKRYSYENYLEKTIGTQGEVIEGKDRRIEEMQVMQQQQWNPQVPNQSIGMQMGPTVSSEISQMNAWQTQPTYRGGWVSPQQVQQAQWNDPQQQVQQWPVQDQNWGGQ